MITVAYDSRIFALQQFGGVSRYFYELARGLTGSHSFRPRIIAPLYVNNYLRDAQLKVHGFHIRPVRSRVIWRVPGALNALVSPLLCRALKPDIVHETYFHSGPRLRNVPTVTTVYDMIHEKFPDSYSPSDPTTEHKRASVTRADIVICISEQTRRDLIEIFHVPPSKIRVTYLASFLAIQNPTRPTPPTTTQGKPYLLYVGNRHGYKNFSTLLRAYASLGTLRANLRLVVFGGGDITRWEREEMASLELADMDIQHRSGGDEELALLYRRAVALIYPSLYEGFGIPPLEAMASGCPVICAPTGSLPEVVGDAALLFDPNSPQELAEKIREVFESAELRARLAERGHKRVHLFSWDRCVQETMNIYRELTS
jgi:glycosyltransferase involved in cell wall biosynthesis